MHRSTQLQKYNEKSTTSKHQVLGLTHRERAAPERPRRDLLGFGDAAYKVRESGIHEVLH